MKILIVFCVISLSAAAMWLQSFAMNHATTTSTITDTTRSPSEVAVSSEFFRRTSSSDFVAIGTVTSTKGVVAQLSEQEYKEAADDLSKVDGGILYTFQVEKIVCARTDFKPGVERPQMNGKSFFIFHPSREVITEYRGIDEPVSKRERYLEKQRYLLFLAALPKQKQLTKKYNLDREQTYYAAFEGKQGLTPLSDDGLPLLHNLTEFCEAISPVDAQQKVERLNALMQSAHPELQQSIKEAVQAIKRTASQP